MNDPFRPLRFGAFVLAAASLLLLAACQETVGSPGGESETVAVTLAPSLASAGLSPQGISGDLVVSDVLVFVRDASTGGPSTAPDCFVVASDGTVDGIGATTADCAFSIWDGSSVTPRTLQLPPRDSAGEPIPYDFFLNVRSELIGTTIEVTNAFASEAIPELTTATTLGFEGLTSRLDNAFFRTYDPNDVAECPPFDVEVEPGETVTLYLFPFGFGTGAEICFGGGVNLQDPLVPFGDFGIGPATVELGDEDVTTSALLSTSKRGLQFAVPSTAAPGQTVSVSLPVNGFDAINVADYDPQSGTGPLVDGMAFNGVTASQTLQVVEPPVATEVAPDLTAPEVVEATVGGVSPFVRAYIGGTTDLAEADRFDVFWGVVDVPTAPAPSGRDPGDLDGDGTLDSVRIQEYLCYDFTGFELQNVTLTLYVTDPTGNQSAPYQVTYFVPLDYTGPSPQYCP